MKFEDKHVIGWLESVDLPEWGITGLIAKIDTGAKTSAIHVENLVALDDDEIEFDVILSRKNQEKKVHVKTQFVRRTSIRSSSGTKQNRYVVETQMILGEHEHRVELSLVSRSKMLRRMLIGRRALDGHYVVDVSKTHIME